MEKSLQEKWNKAINDENSSFEVAHEGNKRTKVEKKKGQNLKKCKMLYGCLLRFLLLQ